MARRPFNAFTLCVRKERTQETKDIPSAPTTTVIYLAEYALTEAIFSFDVFEVVHIGR
jgi:hypothetical protein